MTTNLVAENHRNVLSHSSGGQRPEIKVLTGPPFIQRLSGRFHSLPLPASGAVGVPWPVVRYSVSAIVFPWPSPLCPPSLSWHLIRKLAVDLGPIQIVQDIHFISRPFTLITAEKTLVPSKVTFTGSENEAMDISFRSHHSAH